MIWRGKGRERSTRRGSLGCRGICRLESVAIGRGGLCVMTVDMDFKILVLPGGFLPGLRIRMME